MKLGRITYAPNGVDQVPKLMKRIANNPDAKAKLKESHAQLLRRLTGYPISKCREIMSK